MTRSVAVQGAAEILRPPMRGLPHLRGELVQQQTLDGGNVIIREGLIDEPRPDDPCELIIDAHGWSVVPGLVDCHTHLPFAGWRAGEYEQKLRGVPYEQISRGGGGIAASARALRESTDEQVLAQAGDLAAQMLAAGTTCFECKSGYGLARDGELRALRLAQALTERVAQTTVSTALLAHAVPPDFDAARWMDEVEAMLPEVVALGTVSALDIFVESIAFSNQDLERMGALAAAAGLALRCHVEQFAWNGSVPVALQAGARSVDHLSMLPDEEVMGLAAAECAAVLLPAAEFLGAEHRAPGRALLDAGAIVVLATDLNPGTAPVHSMPLVMGLGARLYAMSVREVLAASTLNAAWTLALHDVCGSIEPGKRGDLLVLDGPVAQIPYRLGRSPVAIALIGGEPVYVRDGEAAQRITGRVP